MYNKCSTTRKFFMTRGIVSQRNYV